MYISFVQFFSEYRAGHWVLEKLGYALACFNETNNISILWLLIRKFGTGVVTDSTELRQVWKNAEFQEHYGQKMLGGTRNNRFLTDPEDISTIPMKDVLVL